MDDYGESRERRGYRGMLRAKANAPVHNIDETTLSNIARLAEEGVNRRKIADMVGIPVAALYHWVNDGRKIIRRGKRGDIDEKDNRVRLARIFGMGRQK